MHEWLISLSCKPFSTLQPYVVLPKVVGPSHEREPLAPLLLVRLPARSWLAVFMPPLEPVVVELAVVELPEVLSVELAGFVPTTWQ